MAQGFNFGPNEGNVLSVKDVVDSVIQKYGKGEIEIKKDDKFHEANLLMLNIDKAKKLLGWKPVYDAQTAIEKTVEWYVHFYKKDLDIFDMRENFDSKCSEFNELMSNSSIQHKPLPGIGTFTFLPPTKKGRPSGRKGGLAIETFQMISTPSSQGGHNRCNATWHSPRQP